MNASKPLILAVDTAGNQLGCIISQGDRLLSQEIVTEQKDHCKNIITIVEKTLSKVSLELQDISAFGCIQGPGSFTGLRIGMMAVKTFAHLFQKPLIGINTFERMHTENQIQNAVYLWPAQKNHAYSTFDPLGSDTKITFGKTLEIIEQNPACIYAPAGGFDHWVDPTYLPFEQICGTNFAQRLLHKWNQKQFLSAPDCHPLYVQKVAAIPLAQSKGQKKEK